MENTANLCINYKENTSLPIALRDSKFYASKTFEEIGKILTLWSQDFDLVFDHIETAAGIKGITFYIKANYKHTVYKIVEV